MGKRYQQIMNGRDAGFEVAYAQTVALYPWMGEQEAAMLREAFALFYAWAEGEVVDIGRVPGHFLGLANSAEAVGDVVGAWMFTQCYQWAEALTRGDEAAFVMLSVDVWEMLEGNNEVPGSSRQ